MKKFLRKLLAKQPGKRYASLAAMQRDIAALAGVTVPGGSKAIHYINAAIAVAVIGGVCWWYQDTILGWWNAISDYFFSDK